MLSRASLLCRRPSVSTRPVAARLRQGNNDGSSIGAGAAYNMLATSSSSSHSYSRHITSSVFYNSVPAIAPSITSQTPFHPTQQQNQQTRTFAGRKDRNSTAFEVRPPTKKQRKKYHRRKRANDYQVNKHSAPNSKAVHRRREEREKTERLIEIAQEEEHLKLQLGRYYDKVNELQGKIEESPKFQALLEAGTHSPDEIKAAARDAAKKAAEKTDTPHPPLPTWWQDRMTYDWGDALVDDLMGNSADLTSSPSPYPTFMGGEYGRLRRRAEKLLRGQREEERMLLESGQSTKELMALDDGNNRNRLSDKMLSDLLRAHRDANGKRTDPVGLASMLQLLNELHMPLSSSAMGTWSYTSLLTCCKNPWEGRKVNDLRKEQGVRGNEYFWSALVDVYARSGDFRGAEAVLDEMLDESQTEHDNETSLGGTKPGDEPNKPIAIPPLAAYTSFYSACHKIVSRNDVHPSVKSDAANRAWSRWKEMRIHSVAPDVMAYGALMRIFAAQGRGEQALDLLEEVMDQMMMPVNSETVLNKDGGMEEVLKSFEGDDDGWYDNREGNTVRVKPTTLLFTSALKAVAKSQEIASKFSGGKSKRNKKREGITAHHGKMARKIVVLAEQAEVKQDDGFVAALMLCAAAAGDSSTARAIYLASKVRRMDHLRTCGSNEHLLRLQGMIPEDGMQELFGVGDGSTPALSEGGGLTTGSSNTPALRTIEEEFVEEHAAYEHREYGADTRILSALMLAHSKAMEPKGLGSMWAGRINRGYLCHNSLRYIEAHVRPQYENMAIPGLDSVKAGLDPKGWNPEDFEEGVKGKSSKALRKNHKFNIQQIMGDQVGNRIDDMDSFFDGHDRDPDELRQQEWRLISGEMEDEEQQQLQLGAGGGADSTVDRDWLDNQLLSDRQRRLIPSDAEGDVLTSDYRPGQEEDVMVSGETSLATQGGEDYSNNFDSDSDDDSDDEDDDDYEALENDDLMARAPNDDRDALVQAMAEVTGDLELAEGAIPHGITLSPKRKKKDYDMDDDDDFDEAEFAKLLEETEEGMGDPEDEEEAEKIGNMPGVATGDFGAFKAHLQRDLIAEGRSMEEMDEEEASQLFDMMRSFHAEQNPESLSSGAGDDIFSGEKTITDYSESLMDSSTERSFASLSMENSPDERNLASDTFSAVPALEMQRSTVNSGGMDVMSGNQTMYADDYIEWSNSQATDQLAAAQSNLNELTSSENEVSEVQSQTPAMDISGSLPRKFMSPLEQGTGHIRDLEKVLPGLPLNRLQKVSDEFSKSLGYPSILRLTLAVRENMPEAFSPQCLTRKNLANANHVMAEAESAGLVDAHILNGMLRVHTNSGRIEPALRFYDTEFTKHGMSATTHSDRLLLEMLINKRRIARAFKLKQDIEKDGRSLDILSYGSLIDYYGRHDELGSALLLIKECMSVHGSPPGEHCLKKIRLICRKKGLTDQVGLEKMIGKDPLEWFREGEGLKRKQGKRATSSAMQFGLNRMLDI